MRLKYGASESMAKNSDNEPIGFAHLRTFLRTVGTSQVEAARELNTAQATISRRIDRVQEYFGGQLFASGASGQLSARGLILLKRIEDAVEAFENARWRLNQERPEVCVGYMPVMESVVHRALRLSPREAADPEYLVRFRKMSIESMIPALKNGEIDIAVSYARSAYLSGAGASEPSDVRMVARDPDLADIALVDEIMERVIADVPFAVFVPEHAYVGRRLSIPALKPLVYAHSSPRTIIQAGESWLSKHKLEPARQIRCEFGSEIIGYARSGRGYGILPILWKAGDIEGAVAVPSPELEVSSRLALYSLRHADGVAVSIWDKITALTRSVLKSLA